MTAPKRRWFWLAIVLLWASAIFLTSSTVVTTNQLFSLVDRVGGTNTLQRFATFWGVSWFVVVKGWHVAEYAVLTILLILAMNAWRPSRRWQSMTMGALIAALFAASDEFHQTYVPGRGGTMWDVLIDSVGIGIGVTVFFAKRRNTDQPLISLRPEHAAPP